MTKEREVLKKIKQHINEKITKSYEAEFEDGKRSDRLFTETIVELQLIENMIDEALKED